MGDNASMALIELVDYNEVYKAGTAVVEKKTTRRRGSKAKKAVTETVEVESAPVVATAEANDNESSEPKA